MGRLHSLVTSFPGYKCGVIILRSKCLFWCDGGGRGLLVAQLHYLRGGGANRRWLPEIWGPRDGLRREGCLCTPGVLVECYADK